MRRAGILSLFHRWHCRLYRILSFYDSFQIWRHAGIIFLTHRWLYRLYHILSDFFPTLHPAGGKFHSSLFLPAGIFSLLKVGNTDTTEGNFAHQCCLRRDFFPYTRVATLNFQTWRRRGGGHVTWEVEGVILFLRNRLPPLGHASHITTHVYNLVSCCMGGCPSTT